MRPFVLLYVQCQVTEESTRTAIALHLPSSENEAGVKKKKPTAAEKAIAKGVETLKVPLRV